MASSNLEKEFVTVISDITKEVTDEIVKKTALKSIEELNDNITKLKKEYNVLLEEIEDNKKLHNTKLTELNNDLNKIKEIYTKENVALVQEINDARNKYESSSKLLMKDVKKGKDLFDESFSKIKQLLDNFNSLIKTWDSTMETHSHSIELLAKRIETLEYGISKEITNVNNISKKNYNELTSLINKTDEKNESGFLQIQQQCKSMLSDINNINGNLISYMKENHDITSKNIKKIKDEYTQKYNRLIMVSAVNVIIAFFIVWKMFN